MTALLLAMGGPQGSALASPSSDLSAARATLDRAVAEYDQGLSKVTAIESSLRDQNAELDALVAERLGLQESLGERAAYLYRSGPLAFVQVLLSSSTLNDFIARWDALVRFSRQEAATILQLRSTEKRLSQTVSDLLRGQENASRDLRALESAKATARTALAGSQEAYAAYQKQVAARDAAARAAAATPAPSKASSSIAGSAPASRNSSVPWGTAVASCYGTRSYGVHLASGFTIGPDSMIVAHKTLPFGTLVEFSFRGRTAVATVADRGPYVAGRTWDLGPGVARVLGFNGVETVRYRVIGH
jgi:rare lipoprotein A (peptidoglycan hydrolase)